ncbi:MAG TPA: hypothetical protein VJV78_12050 [Polyangiales bacterium]|nr:hypothetical protein [Polyangiales bacterium]
MSSTRVAIVALLFSSALLLGSSSAHAEARARLALFKTATEDADLGELASALDPVLLSALGEVAAVQISARPALDLPSVQLAIDCVGETADCLRAAAQQTESEGLLAPSVRREGDAMAVTLLCYQPSESMPIRRVQRRYTGDRQGEQALAGVEGMLSELFPAPPEPPPSAAEPAAAQSPAPIVSPPPAASAQPAASRGVPIVPVILGSVGVALLGTSLALGLMSQASEDAYNDIEVSDDDSADRAQEKLDAAETQATAANITLGVGIGALVAGGVFLFWQLKERGDERHASVVPHLARGELGLTLHGAL